MDRADREYYEMIWRQQMYNRSGCGTPLYAFIFAALLFLFCSCGAQKNIERTNGTVIEIVTKQIHDSIFEQIHDSVYVERETRNDTVFVTKYKYLEKWRDKIVLQKDTCWQVITQTVYKDKVIEKQIIPKWCFYALVISGIFIIFALVKFVRWIRIL